MCVCLFSDNFNLNMCVWRGVNNKVATTRSPHTATQWWPVAGGGRSLLAWSPEDEQ